MPRRALAAIALALVAGFAAHSALDRPGIRARVRARAADALRARWGEVEVGDARIGWDLRATLGPIVIPSARRGAPPVIRVERARIAPSFTALLAGRLEPASVRLSGVRIAPGRGLEELRALWARRPVASRRAQRPAAAVRPSPDYRFDEVVVAMPLRGHEIEIGPLAGVMTRRTSEGDELLEADLHLPGDGRISLEARRGAAGMRARLHADGIGPAAIPAELVPISIAEGALSFDVRAEGPNDLSRLAAHGRLTLDRVVSKDERLSPDPVGPLFLEAAGDLDLDVASRRVSLRSAGIRLQRAVTIAVEGEARLVPRVPFALALHTDGTDFGAAMAALPAALAPPPDVPRPAGPLSFRLDVAGPLAAPAEWTLEATLDLGLLRESARRGSPPGLRGAFTYRPEGENGPSVVVGPSNPDFVPLAELPEHLVRAVTTSEDAGFFGHSGFDFDEIRNALAQAQEAGRWVRGGSTITQQLAKNLFLSREKTLARKIREAFSTIALEATVPKPRLLEIYLNVAEWGPGIHGIGRAARHWFGKDARALTPKEAAFLASVIPNPVRYHVMFAKGEVPNFWEERVEGILFKMTEQGVLTGDQLLQALEEPIVFAHG